MWVSVSRQTLPVWDSVFFFLWVRRAYVCLSPVGFPVSNSRLFAIVYLASKTGLFPIVYPESNTRLFPIVYLVSKTCLSPMVYLVSETCLFLMVYPVSKTCLFPTVYLVSKTCLFSIAFPVSKTCQFRVVFSMSIMLWYAWCESDPPVFDTKPYSMWVAVRRQTDLFLLLNHTLTWCWIVNRLWLFPIINCIWWKWSWEGRHDRHLCFRY